MEVAEHAEGLLRHLAVVLLYEPTKLKASLPHVNALADPQANDLVYTHDVLCFTSDC
jgi:hypothetical protein